MGKLVEGTWHDVWYETKKNGGHFVRKDSSCRHWVTPNGSPGPSGEGGFSAEKDRYHLYVSLACPWAHRTLIFRKLKGLEKHISTSVVHHFMGKDGWSFHEGKDVTPDIINQFEFLHQVYVKSDAQYTGRVTVPILWDIKTQRIVSNESSEIIRMFNSAFDDIGAKQGDFYPIGLRPSIESANQRIYDTLNNGVYRCGFATTQNAYDEAFDDLFSTMDWLEDLLSKQKYVAGDRITEADWRLFTTLVRFDPVYFGHFKTNKKRLVDYPNLWAYTRELYQTPGIAETVNMQHIKQHYYRSHTSINPTQIVPKGPWVDFDAPHNRNNL